MVTVLHELAETDVKTMLQNIDFTKYKESCKKHSFEDQCFGFGLILSQLLVCIEAIIYGHMKMKIAQGPFCKYSHGKFSEIYVVKQVTIHKLDEIKEKYKHLFTHNRFVPDLLTIISEDISNLLFCCKVSRSYTIEWPILA